MSKDSYQELVSKLHGYSLATIKDVIEDSILQSGPSGSFIYLDIGSIDREKKIFGELKLIRQEDAPSRAKQVVQAGDVVVSMTRPNLNAVAMVPEVLQECIASTGFFVLRERAADSKFLYFLVQTEEFVEAMSSVVQGALYPAVRPKDIAGYEFLLPPMEEQKRIGEKLEELLSNLNIGVAELKTAQKKLVQYRRSLLKSAVEGILTADWRLQRSQCSEISETGAQQLERILIERRARWEAKQRAKYKEQGKAPPKDWQLSYPEPAQPNTYDLPRLPDGWVWASAEQICDFITKGTTPPKETADSGEKLIPFLRVTNLTNTGDLDFTDKVFVSKENHYGFLARSIVYPNDVLMNIVGPPLGQVSVVPTTFDEWNINQAIAIFRAVDGILPRFVCSYLLSPMAQKWLKARAKTTAGQANLTLEVCRSLPVPLPALAEQEELVAKLGEALGAIVDQEGAINLALKQAIAQRKNILKTAFSGQLVPQNPDDEPASVLLERVRSAREEKQQLPAGRKRRVQQKATALATTKNEIVDETGGSLSITEV